MPYVEETLNPTPLYKPEETHLQEFSLLYRTIHGYVAPTICILGIIANCLNIVVLTRRTMVTPINILLTGLAVSNGLAMGFHLPFVILNHHVFSMSNEDNPSSLANARFLMFYAIFSIMIHSISCWITVSLAVFRYISIRCHLWGPKICSIQRAKLSLFLVTVAVALVCIPNSISFVYMSHETSNNQTLHYIWPRDDTPSYRFLKTFNLWTQALLLKLVPCIILTVLSCLLVKAMRAAERRHRLLITTNKGNNGRTSDDYRRHRDTNRTTRMLLAVVVLFVVTETPHGVLLALSGIIENFYNDVYLPLGDLVDTLALINGNVNFLLYCSMSKKFRDTFLKTFRIRNSAES